MSACEEKPGSRLWRIRIDGWHPARLNQLLYARHWSIAHRLKKNDAETIALSMSKNSVPKAEATKARRRVSLEIVLGPRQRAGDPDAYWKSLLDGLARCGALVNDSHVWCALGDVAFSRGAAKATVILLEDIGAPPPIQGSFKITPASCRLA